MSNYQPRIHKNAEGDFFALIVRVDRDGEESVVIGYSRHFKTLAAAEKSTAKFIARIAA